MHPSRVALQPSMAAQNVRQQHARDRAPASTADRDAEPTVPHDREATPIETQGSRGGRGGLASLATATYAVAVSNAAKKLLAEVLALPDDDRRWLAERLLDRVPRDAQQIASAWVDTAIERLERAERGEAKLVSFEQVSANVQAVLRTK